MTRSLFLLFVLQPLTAQYRNPGILPYLTRRQSRKCKQTNSEEALSMLLCTDESCRVDQLHYIDVYDKVIFLFVLEQLFNFISYRNNSDRAQKVLKACRVFRWNFDVNTTYVYVQNMLYIRGTLHHSTQASS